MEQGDIWHVDLNPAIGHEQANPRYVLVLTARALNKSGIPIIAPITLGGSFARVRGFTVSLHGAGTNATGVVLCHQLRAIDLYARKGKFREKAPGFIIDDVLAKVTALFS